MTRAGRIASYAVAACALWLVGLAATSFALEGRTRRQVAERISESLEAKATIEGGELALVRGWIDLEDLAATRDDRIGHLALRIANVRCELPPLGLALIDRDCRELAVRSPRLEVSTAALWKRRPPKRPPLHTRRVVIDDAKLALSASALLPTLGQVAIHVAHAEAGDTVMKTPLSWLFALHTLDATLELPSGIQLHLTYAHGELRVAGGMFGATPVALPIALPVAELADDPAAEVDKLIGLGKDIAKRLLAVKAADWLKSKLP